MTRHYSAYHQNFGTRSTNTLSRAKIASAATRITSTQDSTCSPLSEMHLLTLCCGLAAASTLKAEGSFSTHSATSGAVLRSRSLSWKKNPLDTDSKPFTLLASLRNKQISDIPKISINVIRDKATTLKLLLTPCTFRGVESWKPSREQTDDWDYSDLDIVRHFLPAHQYCHGSCRPFLAYQQVAAAVYQELWHGAAGDHLDRGKCVVCGGYVDCRMSGNRRSDLLALVAWMCAMFEVRLRLASN